MCQDNNNTNSKKGKHLEYSERQSIERWWNRDKRTKVEIAGLLDRSGVKIDFGHVSTEMFGRGLDHFYKEVKRGLLDQILVRPRNITFQVLCSNFQTSKIGRLLEYTIILIYAIFKVDIEWSLYKVFVLAFMILGSMILFFSILLLKASFSFWTIEGMEAMNIISDGGRDVASYPISIYKKWFAFIFTYIIPFGCVNYYPALYFLDKAGAKAWYGFLPFATLIFLFFAFKIWNFGLKSYKSTGS